MAYRNARYALGPPPGGRAGFDRGPAPQLRRGHEPGYGGGYGDRYEDDMGEAMLPAAMGPGAPPSERDGSADRAVQSWRSGITALPGAERARGAAGVYGGEWDRVYLVVDNARLPRDQGVSDGKFTFTLSDTPSDDDRVLYVPRPLAAVRRITIDEFSWPTVAVGSVPAQRTNRAEVSVLITEIADRAPVQYAGIQSHFRGNLSAYESATFVGMDGSSITDVLARSLNALAKWYRPTIEMHPPVSLSSLTTVVRRGDRLVVFHPYRLSVDLSFGDSVTEINLSLSNGFEHNLEEGMEVYFEADVYDGSGTLVTEAAKDTVLVVSPNPPSSAMVATFTTAAHTYTGTATNVPVLIPARRFQMGFEFEVARVERE